MATADESEHAVLLGLDDDLLRAIVEATPREDELACALVCRRLRDLNTRRPLRTPLCALARSAARLQWGLGLGAPVGPELCAAVASTGSVDDLQLVLSRASPDTSEPLLTQHVSYAAALGGHLGALRWLRWRECPMGKSTCRAAALGGHLHTLRVLREEFALPWGEGTVNAAAASGVVEVVDFAVASGCPFEEHACLLAARGGHLPILEYLRARSCPWEPDRCASACAKGASAGVLSALARLLDRPHAHLLRSTHAMQLAAECIGYVQTMAWLHANGGPAWCRGWVVARLGSSPLLHLARLLGISASARPCSLVMPSQAVHDTVGGLLSRRRTHTDAPREASRGDTHRSTSPGGRPPHADDRPAAVETLATALRSLDSLVSIQQSRCQC